jgi:paraquat-inducible protein B
MNNPMAKYAISWMNPVIALLSQGNEKIHNDFVGYFANAALSNAKSIDDVKANVNAFIKQFRLDDNKVAQGTIEAAKAGLIDEGTAMAWLNGIEERTNPKVKLDLTSPSNVEPAAAGRAMKARPTAVEDQDSEPEAIDGGDEVLVDDAELAEEEEYNAAYAA